MTPVFPWGEISSDLILTVQLERYILTLEETTEMCKVCFYSQTCSNLSMKTASVMRSLYASLIYIFSRQQILIVKQRLCYSFGYFKIFEKRFEQGLNLLQSTKNDNIFIQIMNRTPAKNIRSKSNGKHQESPEGQSKTQTSSQNQIKKVQTKTVKQSAYRSPEDDQISKQGVSQRRKPYERTLTRIQSSSSSSLDGSQVDREEVLQMQVKQLKRENQFLRSKIQQMTADNSHIGHLKKKKTLSSKIQEKSTIDSMHLNVHYLFKEISGLLSSVSKLFHLDNSSSLQSYQLSVPEYEQLECPIGKHYLFKTHFLTKKLQKILLQEEETKYPLLLSLFGEFYRYKEEAQNQIKASLESMIAKASSLNQWLLQKAQLTKAKDQRGSKMYSPSTAS